jgi:arylsulfatase A-like enzyme
LLILSPKVEPGVRFDPVGSIDVAPTLLDLAGVSREALAGRGRSLLARPGEEPQVFGMRGAVSDPELRTDGQYHPIDQELFYLVDADGSIVRGEGRATPADHSDAIVATGAERLFQGFAQQLEENRAPRLDDPEVQRGLRALGYIR